MHINTRFYSLHDTGQDPAEGVQNLSGGIWGALAVNEEGSDNFIGNRNMEIVVSNGDNTNYLNTDISAVYIPMSRMIWKDMD